MNFLSQATSSWLRSEWFPSPSLSSSYRIRRRPTWGIGWSRRSSSFQQKDTVIYPQKIKILFSSNGWKTNPKKAIRTLFHMNAHQQTSSEMENIIFIYFRSSGAWPTLISVLSQPLLARNALFLIFVILHLLNLFFCVRNWRDKVLTRSSDSK